MSGKVSAREAVFNRRFEKHFEELRWLYMELYDNSSMFAELCDHLRAFDKERSRALRARDLERESHPDW